VPFCAFTTLRFLAGVSPASNLCAKLYHLVGQAPCLPTLGSWPRKRAGPSAPPPRPSAPRSANPRCIFTPPFLRAHAGGASFVSRCGPPHLRPTCAAVKPWRGESHIWRLAMCTLSYRAYCCCCRLWLLPCCCHGCPSGSVHVSVSAWAAPQALPTADSASAPKHPTAFPGGLDELLVGAEAFPFPRAVHLRLRRDRDPDRLLAEQVLRMRQKCVRLGVASGAKHTRTLSNTVRWLLNHLFLFFVFELLPATRCTALASLLPPCCCLSAAVLRMRWRRSLHARRRGSIRRTRRRPTRTTRTR